MERKLRFLEKEIKKDDIPMLDAGDSPDAPQVCSLLHILSPQIEIRVIFHGMKRKAVSEHI